MSVSLASRYGNSSTEEEGGGGSSGKETGTSITNNNNDPPLEYPRDFFNQTTYRKGRPAKGVVETEPPDGNKMLQEVESIRASLRSWIMEAYLESVRREAKARDMKMASTNAFPVTGRDIRAIISSLENNETNQKKIYAIFHQFHRDRHWLSDAVDNWFRNNNMTLLPPVRANPTAGQRQSRQYQSDRGGFGVVARQAKSQAISKFMSHMQRKAGWSIATTKKTNEKTNYEPVKINADGTSGDGCTFYVVTNKSQGSAGDGNLKVERVFDLLFQLLQL